MSAPVGATLQFKGDVGASPSTAYTVTVNAGTTTAVWSVTTSAAVPTITTPAISSPANGTANLNPAANTPAGIPLVSDTYVNLNGAGTPQTSSEWEVYEGGLSSTTVSTNSVTAVAAVAPPAGTAVAGGYFGGQISTTGNGVADYNLIVAPAATGQDIAGITYKTSNSSDTNPNSQDEVYGKLATDQFNDAAHPAFQWAKNLIIGGFSDWYIPAKNELEILYFNLKPTTDANTTSTGTNPNSVPARAINYTAGNPTQTASLLFQSGGSEAFATVNGYWSSSEFSSDTTTAWRQFFFSGSQNGGSFASLGKNVNLYARAIRRVAASTVLAQTLTISAAATDGFALGQSVKGSVSNAVGTITAIDGTSVTVSLTSGTFQIGDFLKGNGTAITGSPFTVSSAPFTTVSVPQAALATSSTYYARVKYATTNPTATTSSFSAWSSFATAASFVPAPGTAMDGGYFGGQINDGGIIYNLIVGPRASAQNGGGTPTTTQYKTTNSSDSPAATYQNVVYGFPANQLDFTSTYPAFQFARSLSIGGFND